VRELVKCKECNDTGTLLVKCHQHGDISHAEQCLCQVERELNFMDIHGITNTDYSMGNGKVTTWRKVKGDEEE
tara:strand:+ start:149 stop:367 length:219 start_codon:yes stop_codon:yes gene_type:complete